uniref:J domain-containing protein n=1 Tax=Leersia perrieri TaxID=77586 RepID=A0A0D9UZJ8_9ORYZ
MDPAGDPLSASAPFPTIPAAEESPRHPRVGKSRRQFRSSDHPINAAASSSSSSSTRRLGVDLPFGHGVRRGAGSRAPSGFVFGGGGDTASGVDVEVPSPSASSWSSSGESTSFVFGASDMGRSFSFGSGSASPSPPSSFSATTVGELNLDDRDPSSSQGDADASVGNGEMNVHSVLSPSIVSEEIEHRDEGLGVPSQTTGCESIESDCSVIHQVVKPSLYTGENKTMEFAKAEVSAEGGVDSKESKFVFVFGENSEERGFTTDIAESEIKKGGLVEKKKVAFDSDQLDALVAEADVCAESNLQGARHACKDPRGVSTTAKASNTSSSGFVVQYSSANVSSTKLSDEGQSPGVQASELGDLGLPDEQSFTVRDHNETSRGYGGVKGVNMNKGTVQQETAHQVLQPLFTSDCKAASEVNLHLKEVTNFRLEGSDSSKGNSGTKEEDVNCFSLQPAKSNHDRTVVTSLTNQETSSQSDFIFVASTFDQSTLHSQRRHNKKKIGGMNNNANSIQSHQTSAIGLARSEISRQQYTGSPAQWTKYNKADPKTVTMNIGPTSKENLGHQEDCETWRIRGNKAHAEGQLARAEEYYTHGINSVSLNEASWKSLMLCYSNRAATRMSLGRMRGALSDCQKATYIDSSFLKAQVRAANCLLALGDVEEAQKGFEMCLKSSQAASLDSKIVEEASDGIKKAQKISNFMLLSKEYLVKKEFDKIPSALKMISDALSISTYSDNLMMMKAEALLLVCIYVCGKILNRYAKQSQQSVSSLSTTISELLHLKAAGNGAFQAGKYSEAVEHYTSALLSNSESLRFSAICFANRAAAYQAMGQILDAIADCSLAIALDSNYCKAISRRAGLYELIGDYDQAGNDLRRLISLLARQLQENRPMYSEKSDGIRSNLNRANLRLSALERDAKKGIGIEPSCTYLDIKKAYRKAALRHHPDKAGNFLVRSENINHAVWRKIASEIRKDADYLFKLIGKAYTILSETTMKSR